MEKLNQAIGVFNECGADRGAIKVKKELTRLS